MELLTGTQYVKYMAICAYDKSYEKRNWVDRITHFDTLYGNYTALPKEDKSDIYDSAYNPVGLLAAITAYEDALAKKPSGYMISLDASSSGLQLLGIAMRCTKSLDICGLDPDKCADAYQDIYTVMQTYDGVDENITKAELKGAIMPALYGSRSEPLKLFGEDGLAVFDEVMNETVTGAWALNNILQSVWNRLPADQFQYGWTLPDGFEADITTNVLKETPVKFLDNTYAVINKVAGKPEFHKGLAPNIVHSIDGYIVREMERRCNFNQVDYIRVANAIESKSDLMCTRDNLSKQDVHMLRLWDYYKATGILSLEILQYINGYNIYLIDDVSVLIDALESLPSKPFELVHVHDCFRSLANYGNDVRQQYNIILNQLNNSTLMESILSEILGTEVKLGLGEPIDNDALLHANYTLA